MPSDADLQAMSTMIQAAMQTSTRELIKFAEKARVDANMSATVDFKNMPAWVRTAVDDNGRFKNLKINRSTPQNGRAGSGLGELQSLGL